MQDAMTRKAWNAYQLADASGVPQPTIQRFLSGTHRDLRSSTVRKLAAALDMSEGALRGLHVDHVAPLSTLPAVQEPTNHYDATPASLQLSTEEQRLIEAYRLLDPIDREDLVVQFLARAERARRYMTKASGK